MKKHLFAMFTALSMITLAVMGCDQLTNKTMGVAILTKIPNITENSGIDQRLLTAFGELPVDEATAVTTLVAERPSLQNSDVPPEGISGATVRLQWLEKSVLLNEVTDSQAKGTYMAVDNISIMEGSSAELFVQEELEYIEDSSYFLYIDIMGDYYDLTIDAPPAIPPSAVTLSPALSSETITDPTGQTADLQFNTHPKGEALAISWESEEPQHAFLTLARIDYAGTNYPLDLLESTSWQVPGNNPIFDNFPREPQAFLDLVLESPETQATLAADLFSEAGVYILLLTPVAINSDNQMALGSAGIAGVATPFMFLVTP